MWVSEKTCFLVTRLGYMFRMHALASIISWWILFATHLLPSFGTFGGLSRVVSCIGFCMDMHGLAAREGRVFSRRVACWGMCAGGNFVAIFLDASMWSTSVALNGWVE